MRKHIFSWLLVLATIYAQAQEVSMGFIPSYHPSYPVFNIVNAVQQHNGDIVSNVLVANVEGNNAVVVGNNFYKASPVALQYTDSLFIANSNPPFYMLARNPLGDGNLRVNVESDANNGTAVRISHFPDYDLNINPAEDVVVQLCDTFALDYSNSILMDRRNDLILKYYTENLDSSYTCHISRVGLDGTLKHNTVLPQTQNFLTTMGEFDSQPSSYFQWTSNEDGNLMLYVIDSLFNVTNYLVVNRILEDNIYEFDSTYIQVREEFWFGNSNSYGTFVISDEGDLLVAAPYTRDSAFVYDNRETGLAVARYDLRTMQQKALIHFNDQPGPSTEARCLGFQKASNGDIYIVFRETTPYNKPTMTAAKLDRNLNLIWRRYCYEQSYGYDPSTSVYSSILNDDDGSEIGMFIVGYAINLNQAGVGIFHFFVSDDGYDEIHEGETFIRPYAFYPNPVQDWLHLQYSPDVQPACIELFDLQGRLVSKQSQGLDNIELQGLALGQYVMKVTLRDGKVFTDKVVKE